MISKKKYSSSSLSSTSIALVFALLIFFVGYRTGQRAVFDAPENVHFSENLTGSDLDFSPYWKAWRILEEKFIAASSTDTISAEDRLYGSIEGLAASYNDPYTVFLPPREAEIFQTSISGSFSGVGMEVGMRDGILTIIAPLKGTPADKAGVQPGDYILKIDGTLTQGMSVDEAVELIRGEKGTEVVLTLLREGEQEPLDIPIVRDDITIPSIHTEFTEDNIFIIELYNFSAPSIEDFKKALDEFNSSSSTQLLLDLRGNPGGFLDAAIDMASYFLPQGKVVVIEDFGDEKKDRTHRSKGYTSLKDGVEIVILVNQGSASASEILAGALSEHGRAILVGEKTYGKGSVQELISITDDTDIKVTVARWLTPNGVSISQNGITPDVVIPLTREDIENAEDLQREAAFEILRGEKGVEDFIISSKDEESSIFDSLR